jgi:hypothetical protein
LVGCVVAALCLAAAQTRAAEDSWVGKRIIVTKNSVKAKPTEDPKAEGGDAGRFVLDEMTYTVEEEKGKSIKVRQRGISG